MNIKHISIFLLVFFLTITAVSANSENITNEDNVLSVTGDYEDLSVSNDNVSLASVDGECLSVSSDDNVSLASVDGECLSVSSDDNVSLASVKEVPVAISVESELSSPIDQSKLSLPVNQEDSKLTSIYDKVYSKKDWKSAWLCTISYKYAWSAKKIKKVTNKKVKSVKTKTKKIVKKYVKKGWTFNRVYYNTHYGKNTVKVRFYLQFYRTVYYDGYGNVLYVC